MTKTKDTMEFEEALRLLKQGNKVARRGWNGEDMFLFLIQGYTCITDCEPVATIMGKDTEVLYQGHIVMKTADGKIVPWVASQTDLLADDWVEVQ